MYATNLRTNQEIDLKENPLGVTMIRSLHPPGGKSEQLTDKIPQVTTEVNPFLMLFGGKGDDYPMCPAKGRALAGLVAHLIAQPGERPRS